MFQQHDIQEFCRVLFDVIDETMKNSSSEGFINQLFEGNYDNSGSSVNYVKCLKCGNQSRREEKWMDLQITVKSDIEKIYNDSLELGLENYLKPEKLDGDNKYYCENCQEKVKINFIRLMQRKGRKLKRLHIY